MKFLPHLLLLLLAPLSALAAAPAPLKEGVDYTLIDKAGPFAPLDGRIEVVEVFGYSCPHCAHFAPAFDAWAARQPKDVRVTLVPAAFGGPWDAWARAYLAADELGIAKRSHADVFRAVHETQALPLNPTPDELGTFYAGYGVSAARYVETLRGAKVEQRFNQARDFAVRTQAPGTPAIIVDGKYLVRGRDFDELLRNTDLLVARERAAHR